MLSRFERAVGLVIACVGGACGGSQEPEHATGPSVLLVTLDTTRADRLGCYGHTAAKTPHLDGLARDGVRFARALAPVPLTLPSHATLLSGVHPSAHGVHVNVAGSVHPDVRTLSEEFQDRGYRTGAFLAAWVLHDKFGLARGFDYYANVDARPPARRPGNEVVDGALTWLDGAPEEPFFAWVHLFDAHDPYHPPPGFRDGFEHPYDGELAFIDAQIGRLLAWLDERGLTDETIVVIAGDHGESLGDHDEDGHGVFLYDTTMHVPLILRGPEISAGTVVDSVVGLVDFAPTLHELYGWPVPDALEGRSLAVALGGGQLDAQPVFMESEYAMKFGWAPLTAVATDEWKFVEAPRPELYRTGAEEKNLAEEYPDVVERMRRAMDAHRRRSVVREGNTVTLDEREEASMGALGYVGDSAASSRDDIEGLDDPKDHKQDLRAMLVEESLENWASYAGYLAGSGRFEEALAAVRMYGRNGEPTPAILCAQGDALLGLGQMDDALRSYQVALALEPDRGQTHSRLGKLLATTGAVDEALVHCEKYVEAEPESANAHTNLANALFRKLRVRSRTQPLSLEDFEPGIDHLRTALKCDPAFGPAHTALVTVYTDTGRPREALKAMRAGANALPGDPSQTGRLAWHLATAPDALARDAREALEYARAAVSANPNSALNHDILAAAHAHAGDFPKALDSAKRALRLARDAGNNEYSSAIEARLDLYRNGRPFRNL